MMKKLKNNKGQAIFEFIVFLPFFLILLSVLTTMGGAINGAINQNKAVRGYFYYLVKNNSTIPPVEDLDSLKGAVSGLGMYSIGWRDYSAGNTPFGPCYRLLSFATGGEKREENCGDRMLGVEGISTFVKVFSVYGVCSTSYFVGPSGNMEYNPLVNASISGDCSIR